MAERKEALVVLAAGRGRRAGGTVPKQYADLGGRPVLVHAIGNLLAAFGRPVPRLVLVIRPEDRSRLETSVLPHLPEGVAPLIVTGGAERALSVKAALEALAAEPVPPTHVFIHDGARPFVSRAMIAALRAALAGAPAAAPALPVTDALWRGEEGHVVASVPRAGLFRAQTPQAFAFPAILAAHRAHADPMAADDVAVARAHGLEVAITPGDEDNIKITHPADFVRAGRILAARASDALTAASLPVPDGTAATGTGETEADHPDSDCKEEPPMPPALRLGHGFDVHAFTEGDRVILGGIAIPHDRALKGHSDADVVLHALADALYGALAEGDIGRHFPPSDPRWKGAASDVFLEHAACLARERGFEIANLDVTVIAEAPKIGPHAEAMAARIARICALSPAQVSVKATTSEGLGFTGRREGIAAMATALLMRR